MKTKVQDFSPVAVILPHGILLLSERVGVYKRVGEEKKQNTASKQKEAVSIQLCQVLAAFLCTLSMASFPSILASLQPMPVCPIQFPKGTNLDHFGYKQDHPSCHRILAEFSSGAANFLTTFNLFHTDLLCNNMPLKVYY